MATDERDIAELQALFQDGALTAVALCQAFLERIEQIDRSGPCLLSVIETNPDALEIAAALDRERKQVGPRGPLHGVPILLKDAIDTGDRMTTTGGSLAMEGHRASEDAFVAAQLRRAGAVLLGKTNMSEWGYMRSTRGCSGWSSRGGQVRNPYVLDRSPSGSSSGSGVAVAANLCTAAIGAEVDGSVVRPASINGIVGLKPTVGLIGRSGIMPVAAPQDTAGPMARSVGDLARVLNALTGLDPQDDATQAAQAHTAEDYTRFLDPDALKGARLGLARDLMGDHEGVDAIIEEAVRVLRDLGAEVIDPAEGAAVPLFGEAEMTLFLYEMKAGLNRYLAEHPNSPMRSLTELIAFNRANADRVMPFFKQELFEMVEASGGMEEPAYEAARAECIRLSRSEGIDRVLKEHALDAIIAPTDSMPAWSIDPVNGDRIVGGCSSPAAMAGYPHLTVPAGYLHDHLPVALSFFSTAWQEGKLLSYGYAFEQATKVRRQPQYLATLPL
ncbi:MAG: amidase [Kiloniellales bacterium]